MYTRSKRIPNSVRGAFAAAATGARSAVYKSALPFE